MYATANNSLMKGFRLLLGMMAAMGGTYLAAQTTISGTYTGAMISGSVVIAASTSATFTAVSSFTGPNLALGNYATLNWNQNGTLVGKTITAGATSGYYGTISVGANNTLTLDSLTSMTGTTDLYGTTGSMITNQGTITNNSGTAYIYAPTFSNQGTITANGCSTINLGYVYNNYNFTNASGGTITANGTNTSVILQGVLNLGVLSATNSGALVFEGPNSTASLGVITVASGGHAYLDGTLDNTSATLAAPSGGQFELDGGTISHGTIAAGALAFTGYGGTLNNVSYTGDLTLPANDSITFTGGTAFTGSNLTLGNYATLNWNQNGTLTGKTIVSGLTSGYYAYLSVGYNNSLTLDSATSLTGDVYVYGTTGSTITNQGTITNNNGSGYLYAPTLINQGTITANAGSTLYLGYYYSNYNTTNTSTGTITANGSNANVYLQGVLNQGLYTATNAGILTFQGTNTTASLGNVTLASGGRALLNGTLDNTAATLTAPTGGKFELYGGTINNGTIGAGALGFTSSGGTLSNVSITGDLVLPTSSYVNLASGSMFSGTNLQLANSAGVYWQQPGTLAGKALTFGNGAYIYVTGTNDTLTLDSATTATGDIQIYTNGSTGTAVTNQGTINHTSASTGYLYAPTFTNQGTVNITAGGLYLGNSSTYAFANTASGAVNVNGGTAYIYSPFSNAGLLNVQSGTLYTNNFLTSTGVIKGSGTINGLVTLAGGSLAPGNSVGTLTINGGNLAVTGSSTLDLELSGATADKLVFQNPTGTVNLGSLLNVSLTLLGAPTPSTTFTVMTITSSSYNFSGTFANLPTSGSVLSATFASVNYDFMVNYLPKSITFTSVPEPGTWALLGSGLVLLACRCRRRRSA